MMTSLDTMPKTLIFWRSFMQWVGGIGVIAFGIAMLSRSGLTQIQLYRSEGRSEELMPSVVSTGRRMWAIYVFLTVVFTGMVLLSGIPLWDAINLVMVSLATGGFAPHDAGMFYYNNPLLEALLIPVMLAGALMGGKKGVGGALRGGIGGGAMAMLGIMAFQALRKSGAFKNLKVPLGLVEPKTAAEKAELERNEELVLKAMINAAKADGRIDEREMQRITGNLEKDGISGGEQELLAAELHNPLDTDSLVRAVPNPQVAAQVYAASLLAVELDTDAEKQYLADLAGIQEDEE